MMRLTQRMEDLIESLLHFSRLGRVELSMQKNNLNEVVKNVIDVLSISLKVPKISAFLDTPVIQCDKFRLARFSVIYQQCQIQRKVDKWVEMAFLDSNVHSENQNTQSGEEKRASHVMYKIMELGFRKYLDTIFRIFKRLHASNMEVERVLG